MTLQVNEAKRILESNRQRGWIDLVNTHGKTFIYQNALATCDPDVVQTMLMHRPHTQHRSAAYKLTNRLVPGSSGVLFMDGEEWQQHVHAVMPVFTKSNIDSHTQVIHETVNGYLSHWKDGQQADDLYQDITEVGLQVVLRTGYGLDPNDPLAAAFGKELMDYKLATMRSKGRLDEFGLSASQIKDIPVFISGMFSLSRQMKRLQTLVQQILEQRQRSGHEGTDWIHLLHQARFPLPLITDELNHIYGAFNAIDYAVTCALFELSRHPEWVQRLRREFAGAGEFPTRETFETMPDTVHFMKEVFRYYPVAMAVARKTGEPLAYEGGTFPAGKEVLLLIYALHHHPDFWDDPFTFNPDRWQQSPRVPSAYVPFLTGPRQCIGRHLAELHFMITLYAIVQHWDVTVLDHTVQINPYLIPRFERALPAQIRKC